MKNIIISSNSSGGGKTTMTLGIMRAIIKRGYSVQPYKIGPDYIDAAFHSHITGAKARNLDIHLMGEAGVKASIERGHGDFGIIEGVMGLYDGIGIDTRGSTAHIAKALNLPVLLVLSPKAQVATLCAEINGLVNYDNVEIAGVILNNISEGYYKLLKAAIEKNCSIPVLGYLPYDESISLKSRHLGLVQSSEIENLKDIIEGCSDEIEKHIDLDRILEITRSCDEFEDNFHLDNKNINISVAYDKAFSFYYRENLEILEEMGKVTYFSPMKDKKIPDNTDFLYIGGGYPEEFIDELSSNVEMLNSIKQALESGVRCYAECGGVMYLTEAICDKKAVNFFSGKAYMTNKLQNFGYAELEIIEENSVLPRGLKINCHEFHHSYIKSNNTPIYLLKREIYDGSILEWNCGYQKNNTIGGYAHVHFFNNMEFLKILTDIKLI